MSLYSRTHSDPRNEEAELCRVRVIKLRGSLKSYLLSQLIWRRDRVNSAQSTKTKLLSFSNTRRQRFRVETFEMQYKLGFRVSIIESKPLLFSSRNLCLNEPRISSDRNRVVWKYKSLCSSNFVCLTAGMVRQCDSDRYAKNAVSDRFGSLPATNVSYYN
jgi:hypothetical protein